MTQTTGRIALCWTIALCAAALPASAQDAGKEAFLENNCNRCHSVESQGIEATSRSSRGRGPDLGNIGETRDAEWLAKYIEREVQADGRDHPMAWRGGDEGLQAIATWLASLKGAIN